MFDLNQMIFETIISGAIRLPTYKLTPTTSPFIVTKNAVFHIGVIMNLQTFTVKNKREKMSPGGLITLPMSARKALAMRPGEGTKLAVKTDRDTVIISKTDSDGVRVSARGTLLLPDDAQRVLAAGAKRHYWFEGDPQKHHIVLHPYKS
jgi:hypothetical protein